MDKAARQIILKKLMEIDPSAIVDTIDWPMAYFSDIKNIKAIVLGCDPSNDYNNRFNYVFNIEKGKDRRYFAKTKNNLAEVKISKEEVYVQNLCQNYFTNVTLKNKIWQSAAKVWIPYLIEELNLLPISKDVPVFITAEVIYKALLKEGIKKKTSKKLYQEAGLVPISANDNYLDRPLIPLFRGGNQVYVLKNWPDYVEVVKAYFNNNKGKNLEKSENIVIKG